MSTTLIGRLGAAGVATLATVALISGCGGSKSKTAADGAATSTSTAAAVAADDATPPDATPTKVVATGGGNFCKQVADSINNDSTLSDSNPTDLKTEVQQERALEAVVLKSAPKEIKSDLNTIFTALDQYFDAISKANYDYTKLDPTMLTSLTSPQIQAAEQRVDTYIKNTCGIDTGDDSSDGTSSPAS